MKRSKAFSVVIAGAGPAGLLLARDLARAGIATDVYERNGKHFVAHNWSDAVEREPLRTAGFDVPDARAGRLSGTLVKKSATGSGLFEPHAVNPLQVWAPDRSSKTKRDVDFGYITTDRVALHRMLTRQALDAGARIHYGYIVTGITGNCTGGLSDIRITGCTVRKGARGRAIAVEASIVVDASGFVSALRTSLSAGGAIERAFSGGDIAFAWRTVRRLDARRHPGDHLPDHYRYGLHKGYFWTHLHDENTVDVGGGVKEEPGQIDPRSIINEMIAEHPSITRREIRGGGGRVLVGISPYSLVASGFLAVGDAAGQTIPTTGCGVGAGMTGAMLAARSIIVAAQLGDPGIARLWSYNRRWFSESGRGANCAALGAMKDILQDLSHDELSFLVRKDILSGELLTPTINGFFHAPGAADMLKTFVNGLGRPALLMKLNRATSIGAHVYRHYKQYPSSWNPGAFTKWMERADRLFRQRSR